MNRHSVKVTDQRHAPRPTRQKYPYLLTGLVRCQCGQTMRPASCRGKSGTYWPYYRCDNTRCKAAVRMVRADQLDAETLRAVCACYTPEVSARIARDTWRRAQAQATEARPEIERLRATQQAARQAIARLTASLTEATSEGLHGARGAILADLDRRQRELDACERDLAAAVARSTPDSTEAEMRRWVEAWAALASDIASGGRSEVERRAWASAHVQAVGYRTETGTWEATYWLPYDVIGQSGTPKGAKVTLVLAIARRSPPAGVLGRRQDDARRAGREITKLSSHTNALPDTRPGPSPRWPPPPKASPAATGQPAPGSGPGAGRHAPRGI